MKLYAAHQFERFEAPIDNTYIASAHSADTVISWYNENKEAGDIAVSAQVIFPFFVILFVVLFVFFIIELEPYEHGKKLRSELGSNDNKVRANADAGLLTKYIAAALFHFFTLSSDIAALVHYQHVPKAIQEYYYAELKFWAAPITMIIFDIITLILFIFIPPMTACCILYIILRKCEQKLPESIVARCKQRNYTLIYSVISPLSCIASHSYHIVFAFINNPYHATSILLIYAIIAFVNIQGFQKLFYFVYIFISGGKCSCCHIKNTCGRYCMFGICFILEFLFMGASIALSIALIIELPLSNAIDDAPNHLYVIYQASVTFFAALIAFQVIFRQTNSTFNVFIEAIDDTKKNDANNEVPSRSGDDTKAIGWTDLSEKEKEILVAKLILSHLKSGIVSPDALKHIMKSDNRATDQGAKSQESAVPRRAKSTGDLATIRVQCDSNNDSDKEPLLVRKL